MKIKIMINPACSRHILLGQLAWEAGSCDIWTRSKKAEQNVVAHSIQLVYEHKTWKYLYLDHFALYANQVYDDEQKIQGNHPWTKLRKAPAITSGLDPAAVLPQMTLKLPGYVTLKKVKVAHTWLPSVGFRNWSRFLAVSLQVTWIINTTVGCHYFPPGSSPLKGNGG